MAAGGAAGANTVAVLANDLVLAPGPDLVPLHERRSSQNVSHVTWSFFQTIAFGHTAEVALPLLTSRRPPVVDLDLDSDGPTGQTQQVQVRDVVDVAEAGGGEDAKTKSKTRRLPSYFLAYIASNCRPHREAAFVTLMRFAIANATDNINMALPLPHAHGRCDGGLALKTRTRKSGLVTW